MARKKQKFKQKIKSIASKPEPKPIMFEPVAEHIQQHLREGRPEEKVFDKWFSKLSKEEQTKMRACGCGPYSEMALPRHCFPVYDNAKAFGIYDPKANDHKTIDETWISGEKVSEIIRDLVAMFESSGDPVVEAHWDLVRIIMQMPNAPSQADLARRLGLTKQAVSIRAKKLLVRASDVTPGLLDRVRMMPMPKDLAKRGMKAGGNKQ